MARPAGARWSCRYLCDSLVQACEYERDRHVMRRTNMRSDRLISFVSQDEEWEGRREADRA